MNLRRRMTTARKEGEKLGESEKRGDSEDKALVRVSFRVSNTGKRAGEEIAELYVGEQDSRGCAPDQGIERL